MSQKDERELLRLYQKRVRDHMQSRTRRRKAVDSSPERVADLLGSYFSGDSEAMRRLEEARAIQAWETYVGEAARRVSAALRIRQNTLYVKVQDPLWMQQLSLVKRDLIRKYQQAFPKLQIKDIFFTRYG
jgi:hypothetical protein